MSRVKQCAAHHKPLKRPLPHLRAAPYRGQHTPGHHWDALPHEAIGKKSTSLLWHPRTRSFLPFLQQLFFQQVSFYMLTRQATIVFVFNSKTNLPPPPINPSLGTHRLSFLTGDTFYLCIYSTYIHCAPLMQFADPTSMGFASSCMLSLR